MENEDMYLKDFAESRGVSSKTVSAYINRNSMLKKYKKVKNGKVWLDPKAIEVLSEKYPLAVEKENNLMKELLSAKDEILSMHKFIVSVQPKLLLVEQQAKQLDELQSNYDESISKLGHERIKNQGLEHDLKTSQSITNSLREENKELNTKLQELEKTLEKERSKSWWDKLRGK